jgi:uncharacterized membrane protein YccC
MHQRVLQVCLLLGVALLFSRIPQWEHGSWVLISVGAIIGPFSPLLTFRKSLLRAMGTTAGLLLSAILIAAFSHLPWIIPILGVVLAYGIAFTSQQDYRYFIMIVTVVIALNFSDMYVPFTPFEPISFFASRAMGVFIGIGVYVTIEWFVFGRRELIRWAHANNDLFTKQLKDAIDAIDALSPLNRDQPHTNQTWLSDLSKAQTVHAQAVADLLSGLDDVEFLRAKRLQRASTRLQMTAYRLLCNPLSRTAQHQHQGQHLNVATRTQRLQCLIAPPREPAFV